MNMSMRSKRESMKRQERKKTIQTIHICICIVAKEENEKEDRKQQQQEQRNKLK